MEITKRLKEAGDILGIKVLDHIIIGETFTSFTAQGLRGGPQKSDSVLRWIVEDFKEDYHP